MGALLNIMDYGAATDGRDCTAAIQRAIAAAESGGTIFFPPGNYIVAGPRGRKLTRKKRKDAKARDRVTAEFRNRQYENVRRMHAQLDLERSIRDAKERARSDV